jgi:hypothetical protein
LLLMIAAPLRFNRLWGMRMQSDAKARRVDARRQQAQFERTRGHAAPRAVSNGGQDRRSQGESAELPRRLALLHTAPVARVVRAKTPHRAHWSRTVGVISFVRRFAGDSIPDSQTLLSLRKLPASVNCPEVARSTTVRQQSF